MKRATSRMAEIRNLTRERMKNAKVLAKERQALFNERRRDLEDLKHRPGGKLLVEQMDQEFQQELREWLGGDPRDQVRNVQCHTRLRQLRDWRLLIEPEEMRDDRTEPER